MKKVLYYLWKDEDRIGYYEGYSTLDEAMEGAKENDADEIEETTWDNEENYQNYEPSDNCRTVWKR